MKTARGEQKAGPRRGAQARAHLAMGVAYGERFMRLTDNRTSKEILASRWIAALHALCTRRRAAASTRYYQAGNRRHSGAS